MTTDVQTPNQPVGDIWLCAVTGVPHRWVYLGVTVHMYRCGLCIGTATKDRMRQETNGVG